MGRRIFAIIDVDEEILLTDPNDTVGDRLEQEIDSLKNKGISLESWTIMDEDDEDEFARYINYLVDWADYHASDLDNCESPLSFEKWRDENVL